MALNCVKFSLIYSKSLNTSVTFLRTIRNPLRRSTEVRKVQGTVKSQFPFDASEHFQTRDYQELVKSVKSSSHVSDIDIENALSNEDDLSSAFSNSYQEKYYRESKEHRSFVKKQIIGRKYFKLDFETNLLTYAAKQQIHHLHTLNPTEWTSEFLTQCFPITITGVKKLLNCKLPVLSPQKVKEHDEKVEKRWEILHSGKYSEEISPYTQQMWKEGKIIKENYKGFPKFSKLIAESKEKTITEDISPKGEFSALVKQYVEYKKGKELPRTELNAGTELQVREGQNSLESKNIQKRFTSFNRNKYHIDSEIDDSDYNTVSQLTRKMKSSHEDVPYFQFKENFHEEMSGGRLKADPDYLKWLANQPAENEVVEKVKPVDSKKIFSKIGKFNRSHADFQENTSSYESFVRFDNRHGYQHSESKIRSKIQIKKKSKKDALYKIGQSVYNENGEFLYKLPG